MKCPICKDTDLNSETLANGLPTHQCPRGHGLWLSSNQYLMWLKTQGPPLPEKEAEGEVPTWDTKELKLCPECGRYLTRFRVLPSVSFYLDRCSHCNGVWFDQNEWEVLVARNLQDKVNLFFTKPWQIKIQEAEARQKLDQLYLSKFGPDDYAKIKDLRAWLANHPHRAMLLAYLQANDPYKI